MRRDPQDTAQQLYEIASNQGGYFTSAQALDVGYSYFQQHYHTQRGTWLKIERGIYRLRDYPPEDREDLIRLTLWSHNQNGEPQAVVSHDSALAVHQMSDIMPNRIHLPVPKRGFRKKPPIGVVLHKDDLADDEVEQRHGYQVTSPLRTLLDATVSSLSQEHINQAVTDALEQGLIRYRALAGIEPSSTAQYRIEKALAFFNAKREQETTS